MLIYLIRNRANGKVYIGQTRRDILVRFKQHWYSREPLGSAIRKYGRNSFEMAIIDSASSQSELDAKERSWIAHYRCRTPAGYNIAIGGDGPMSQRRHTAESIRKMSESSKGKPGWSKGKKMAFVKSEETREKLSKSLKGKNTGPHPWTADRNRKCRGEDHPRFGNGRPIWEGMPHPRLGAKLTEDQKERLRLIRTGMKFPNARKVPAEARQKQSKSLRTFYENPANREHLKSPRPPWTEERRAKANASKRERSEVSSLMWDRRRESNEYQEICRKISEGRKAVRNA